MKSHADRAAELLPVPLPGLQAAAREEQLSCCFHLIRWGWPSAFPAAPQKLDANQSVLLCLKAGAGKGSLDNSVVPWLELGLGVAAFRSCLGYVTAGVVL